MTQLGTHQTHRGGSEFRFPTFFSFRFPKFWKSFRFPTPRTVPTHLWYSFSKELGIYRA
uniref:Uncharacterized protein n=1 Tax=Meloidogyne incognita TaxID=6306 RepID=A0A914LL38_MELIC